MRRLPIVTAALVLTTAALASDPPIPWRLYRAPCAGGAAGIDVACGGYGRFLIRETDRPACVELAANGDDDAHIVASYPKPHVPKIFPFPAKRLRELTMPAPLTLGNKAGTTQPGGGFKWVTVLDFDDAHGDSTAWLAGRVAGLTVQTVLAPLDEPALDDLGPVGDLHVLARLCEIVDDVDAHRLPPPTTLNMSFGRLRQVTDPEAVPCDATLTSCQVASVIHYLKAKGTTFVAAAGNHGREMFPAVLDDVVSTGMLDGSALAQTRTAHPAWETPAEADAWIPGNALCLNSWPAPAGSSYSSAMLAGWLVEALQRPDLLATLPDEPWRAAFNVQKNCWVLARGPKLLPLCNGGITGILGPMTANPLAACGGVTARPVATPPPGLRAHTPGPLDSIESLGAPTHPAPESDPCVPCSGVIVADGGGNGSDLVLDLSKSGPLPGDLTFDEVDLRVGDLYYPIALSEEELTLMREGALGTIVVPDGAALLRYGDSPSLWYRLRGEDTVECTAERPCVWSSTPLMVSDVK